MPDYVMVVDLQKCTACGACVVGCKVENNIPDGFFWSHYIQETVGIFPDVKWNYIPTMCNHCREAPCVKACTVKPRAMYKLENGLTLHDDTRCIGCQACENACPYGVIFYNKEKPHQFWHNEISLIEGCTSSPIEITHRAGGNVIPYYNPEREITYAGIRAKNTVEKCTFCDHRIKRGMIPYCSETCPSKARIFGDLADKDSKVNELLQKYPATRMREDFGTEPRVYYIRKYNPENR